MWEERRHTSSICASICFHVQEKGTCLLWNFSPTYALSFECIHRQRDQRIFYSVATIARILGDSHRLLDSGYRDRCFLQRGEFIILFASRHPSMGEALNCGRAWSYLTHNTKCSLRGPKVVRRLAAVEKLHGYYTFWHRRVNALTRWRTSNHLQSRVDQLTHL